MHSPGIAIFKVKYRVLKSGISGRNMHDVGLFSNLLWGYMVMVTGVKHRNKKE